MSGQGRISTEPPAHSGPGSPRALMSIFDDTDENDEEDEEQNPQSRFCHSRHSSPVGNFSEYAALLAQVPGFGSYYQHDTSSSSNELEASNPQSNEQHEAGLFPGSYRAPSTERTVPSALAGTLSADCLLPALQGLKAIMEKKDQLIYKQLKIEGIERTLENDRRTIDKEVKRATGLIESSSTPDLALRSLWARSLARLHASLSKMEANEAELQAQQRLLTGIHNDFRHSVENLYASLTDGAHMDESESSVFEARFQTMASQSPRSTYLHPNIEKKTYISDSESESELRTLSENQGNISLKNRYSSSSSNPLQVEFVERIQNLETETPDLDLTHSRSGNSTMQGKRARPIRSKARKDVQLACWGFHLPTDQLETCIEKAEQCAFLTASKTLRMVRQKDLSPEIAIDQVMSEVGTKPILDDTLMPIRRSIIQTFNQAKVSAPRIADYISVWSANMSQNSWTDLHRSILHDGERLSLLDIDEITLTEYLRELDVPPLKVASKKRTSKNIAAPTQTPSFLEDDSSLRVQFTEAYGPDLPRSSHRQSPTDSIGSDVPFELKRSAVLEHPEAIGPLRVKEMDVGSKDLQTITTKSQFDLEFPLIEKHPTFLGRDYIHDLDERTVLLTVRKRI